MSDKKNHVGRIENINPRHFVSVLIMSYFVELHRGDFSSIVLVQAGRVITECVSM
jgi:hypothetical protein